MEMHEISVVSNTNNKESSVTVKDAYKSYSKTNIILKGLNMTVPRGSIYGLLGPSGCGKTTLLHCILGVSELDSGEIKVKAKTKCDIGYMPQEISLYKELSVIETMIYYGRLFGLSDHEIEKRTDELLAFLELPSKFKIISELSGGQSRRVSFAVALLHDPQLLILDEPTAGVDPVLCVSIWDKLVFMVENENKTVIITTHYIEETRRAHTIGLMRNGRLLAEDSPSQLMTQYNVSNLEDVFLQLCQKQTTFENQTYDQHMTAFSMPKTKSEVPFEQNISCSRKTIFALLTKNFYWMKRNIIITLVLLIVPTMDSLFFSMCIGNDPTGLKLAVVNQEYPQISHCDWLYTEGCNFSYPLSCRFLNKLQQKSYDMIEYHDIEMAINAAKKNKVWGVIHFPKNYTDVMNERIMLREQADDNTLTLSEVEIRLDMSNQYIANMIRRDVLKECVEYLQDLYFHCGWSPRMADLPFKMENPVYGIQTPKFRHSTTPSILCLLHFHLPMIFTAGACLMEKMTGSLNRSLISGVTMLEMAVSLIIVQFIVLSVQSILMMLILFVLYDNPLIVGNLPWIAVLLFMTGVSGTFYGFLITTMGGSDKTVTFMGVGTTFALFSLSGVMWPLEGMHWFLRSFSDILPVTRCVEAFRALSVKDWPVTNPTVYRAFLSNLVWSSIFILITSIGLKRNKGLGSR